ncbi:MAG: hypothetical protein RLZZ46_497 [Bacteroidota bacterium]|jgi:hypothetical protein
MKPLQFLKSFFLLGIVVLLSSCLEEDPPTKVLMQGNWQLTAAVDESGKDILSDIAFPITAIQLTDDNGMVGTQGPMFTYIVYGGSKWIEASGKIKQIFDYANLRFNTGEYFVGEGEQDVFTVEAKLQATAAVGGLKDVLEIFGVANGFLQQTIYHKFLNVKVSFQDQGTQKEGRNQIMVWEFTPSTQGAYNYKDAQGNPIIWNGWPVDRFSKARFTFTKKTQDFNDIVKSAL